MEISNISVEDVFSKTITGKLNKEILSDLSKNNVSSLLISNDLNSDKKLFLSDHDMYIVAEDPVPNISLLRSLPNVNGIHVLTVIAESKLIHSKKKTEIIVDHLVEQGYLNNDQASSYCTLLQEVLINAIEHGNLNLGEIKESTVNTNKWFEKYRKIVDEKLSNKQFSKIPVIIRCYLDEDQLITSIEDFGKGFDVNKFSVNLEESELKPYNMGLHIIKSLSDSYEVDKDGRRTQFGVVTNFHKEIEFDDNIFNEALIKENGKILLVDDQDTNREFARFYLLGAGYKNIEEAANGLEAIEKIKSFQPDIILMDVIMPEMDGFTACRKIKQNPETSHIPILFLSGLTDVKNRVKGYRLGAVDYVNKPIDRNEIIARTNVHIQNGMLLGSLKSYSSRLKHDLNNARKSQENFLPSDDKIKDICKQYGLIINHKFQACNELAGDYWTVFKIDEDRLAIAMADFTGHGVAAALNTVCLHSIFQELREYMPNPTEFVSKVNERLFSMLTITNFATFIYGVLNVKTKTLDYVGCGAPDMVILPDDKKNAPYLLECSGFPIGLVSDKEFISEEKSIKLQPKDTILMYSDALIEAKHKDGEMWLNDGLLKGLRTCQLNGTGNLVANLYTLFNVTAQLPLNDDLTMLSISCED